MSIRFRWLRHASPHGDAKPRHASPHGDAKPRHVSPDGNAKPRHAAPLVEYNTGDARNLLSHLLRRVRRGEEIVIAHAGRPVAKLIPYSGDEPRRPGIIRTQIVAHDDRQSDGYS